MIGKVGARWFAAVALAVLMGWAAMGIASADGSSERTMPREGMSEIHQIVVQIEQAIRLPVPIDLRQR